MRKTNDGSYLVKRPLETQTHVRCFSARGQVEPMAINSTHAKQCAELMDRRLLFVTLSLC